MAPVSAPEPDARSLSTRWMFASGGVASGIVGNAHYFVLIYYNQVLGLSGSLTGIALAVGLIFDAISDPLVGFASDNWKSRWGRRHPFLYASILPSLLFYFLLWHPPSMIQGELPLFIYLVACNIGLRFGITLFWIPAYSIIAEITSDYDERTRLISYITSSLSVVGNGMSVAMYAIWLVPTPEYSDGILNPAGYRDAGLFGALAIALSIAVFSVGLHRFIPQLKKYHSVASLAPREFFRQAKDVVRDASLRAMGLAGILYYTGSGTYAVLWVYIYSFFWEFSNWEISLLVIPMVLGGLALVPLLPRISLGREKKKVAIVMFLGASLVNATPIMLRLAGFFPANGTDVLFWIMMVAGFLETLFFLMLDATWTSMVTDIVEESELHTGRRSEGIILSTLSFAQQCAGALGTLLGGLIIDLIAFPKNAKIGEVGAQTLFELGLVYGPLILVLYLLACFFVGRYRITRSGHSEAVADLGEP